MGSPVRNDGRGLKRLRRPTSHSAKRGSPVRNDGRGLKQRLLIGGVSIKVGSPVKNDGRGLKHREAGEIDWTPVARPSEMTGVD